MSVWVATMPSNNKLATIKRIPTMLSASMLPNFLELKRTRPIVIRIARTY
jgi:hypothetical protein